MVEQRNVPRELPERPMDRALAELAQQAIQHFRAEHPQAFQALVEALDGKAGDLALVGQAKFHVAVYGGDVHIEQFVEGGTVAYRVLTLPEAIVALAEGRLTPLEAFLRAEFVGLGRSADLYQAYEYFVQLVEAVPGSPALQDLLRQFKQLCKL